MVTVILNKEAETTTVGYALPCRTNNNASRPQRSSFSLSYEARLISQHDHISYALLLLESTRFLVPDEIDLPEEDARRGLAMQSVSPSACITCGKKGRLFECSQCEKVSCRSK